MSLDARPSAQGRRPLADAKVRASAVHGPLSDDAEPDPHSVEGRLQRIGQTVSTFLGPVVIVDFLIGFSLLWVNYLLPTGTPGGVVTGALMLVIGSLRRPQLRLRWGGLLMVFLLSVLAFVLVETMHNHMPWGQRTLKIVVFIGAAATVATGRINIRSLIIGGCAGAAVNVPAFYLGLTPNHYPPFLTGFYGDKNIAGMYYAVWGVLGILVLSRKAAFFWVAFSAFAMYLTGSRTAIAALVCAWAWILLRNRVGVVFRLIYTGLGFALLSYAMNTWAKSSAFGDRTGDDWYREQVMKAMSEKVAQTPWYGQGLNSGVVSMGHRQQWFHNSYQQEFVEGGYLLLGTFLFVFIVIGWGLLDRRVSISRELLVAEAAVIVVMICSWKLGEVFITMGAFLIVGVCAAYRLGEPVDTDPYAFTTHATQLLEQGGRSSAP